MAAQTVLPPTSTPVMRAVDLAVESRLAAVDIPAPEHRDPDQCPPEALPLLAREFGVLVFNDAWPLNARRMVVRNARLNALRRGTIWAIRQVLCAFGAIFTIEEDLGLFTGRIRIRNANSIYGQLSELKAAVGEVSRGSVEWTFLEGEAVAIPVKFVMGAAALRVCGTTVRLES